MYYRKSIAVIIIFFYFLLTIKPSISQEVSKPQIILTNYLDIKKEITESDKQYHLIVIYAEWCKPCVDSMPNLIAIIQNNHQIANYFINPDKLNYQYILLKWMEKRKLLTSTYLLDDSYPGGVKKRFFKFKNEYALALMWVDFQHYYF